MSYGRIDETNRPKLYGTFLRKGPAVVLECMSRIISDEE